MNCFFEGTSLRNDVVQRKAAFRGNISQFLLKRIEVNAGIADRFSEPIPAAVGQRLFEHLVPRISALGEHFVHCVREICPECLGILIITEDELKGVHPSGRDCILDRINHVREGSGFLSRLECLQPKLIDLRAKFLDCLRGRNALFLCVFVDLVYSGRIVVEDLHHDVRCKPCVFRQMVGELRFGKGLFSGDEGFVCAISILLQGSKRNARVQSFLPELISIHRCILDRLIVFLTHDTGTHCLRKLIHGVTGSSRVLAGQCRPVGDTFQSCDRGLQILARSCKLGNVGDHVRKVVAGLISKPVQTFQLRIDRIKVVTLRNQRADGCGLIAKLLPTSRNLVNGQRGEKLLSGIHRRIGDVGKGGHSYDFESREFCLYSLNRASECRNVTFLSCGAELIEALSGPIQIQALFKLVQS